MAVEDIDMGFSLIGRGDIGLSQKISIFGPKGQGQGQKRQKPSKIMKLTTYPPFCRPMDVISKKSLCSILGPCGALIHAGDERRQPDVSSQTINYMQFSGVIFRTP